MNLLAFDTSGETCTVALKYKDHLEVVQQTASKQQGKLILPLIEQTLQQANLTLKELDAIAYACGPGSFTGIRIATSVAQGLAFATGKPVIALSSLAVLAQSAYLDHGCETVLVMLDARMQEIYGSLYCINKKNCMELQGEEQVLLPDNWQQWPATSWCGVGNAWQVFEITLMQQAFCPPKVIYADQLPSGKALIQLGSDAMAQGKMLSVAEVLPIYLR